MLKVGDQIPDLTLPNHEGTEISLRSFVGKKPTVIYFYPKNNTPGCTAEACEFRDKYDLFLSKGAEVIGISGDSSKSHLKVKSKRNLPFILLSDMKREAEKAFGVPRNMFGIIPGRVTFISDPSGKIIRVFDSATNPTKHVQEALQALDNLQSIHP